MISWSIQNQAGLGLNESNAAIMDGLLSPSERDRLAELAVPKRRREWLLGRWTAKQLVRQHLADTTGNTVPLSRVSIGNDNDGAPEVSLPAGLPDDGLSLSISHSNGSALCAISAEPGTVVGADIEIVEPRSWQFVEDYFTADEVAQVRAAPEAERDELVNGIWSAKEAVLKALHLGLSVDTRRVSCEMHADATDGGWNRFTATAQTLAAGVGTDGTERISGWWRRSGKYVLTMAVLGPTQRRIMRPHHAAPRPRRRTLAQVA